MKTKIKMNDKVKCKDTGFEGIVDAISYYKYGCIQICVQPPVSKEGEWVKHKWIDEPALEIIKKTKKKEAKPKHGGMNRSHA